jgi:hypothetical protein
MMKRKRWMLQRTVQEIWEVVNAYGGLDQRRFPWYLDCFEPKPKQEALVMHHGMTEQIGLNKSC